MRMLVLIAAGMAPLFGAAILLRLGVGPTGLIIAIFILMIPLMLLTRRPKKAAPATGSVVVDDEAVRAVGPLGFGALPRNQIIAAHIINRGEHGPYWVLQDEGHRRLSILCAAEGEDKLQDLLRSMGAESAQVESVNIEDAPAVRTVLTAPGALTPRLTDNGLTWEQV